MVPSSEKWLFTIAFIRVLVPPLWDKCVGAKWFLLQRGVGEGLGGHSPGAGAAKMQYWGATAVGDRGAQVSYQSTHGFKSEAVAGRRYGGETQKDQSNAANGLRGPQKGSPKADPVTCLSYLAAEPRSPHREVGFSCLPKVLKSVFFKIPIVILRYSKG